MADNSLYNGYLHDAKYIRNHQPLDFDGSGQKIKPTRELWKIVFRLREESWGNDNQIFYNYLHDEIGIIPDLGMGQQKFQVLKEEQNEDLRTTKKGNLIGNAIAELKYGRTKTYWPYLLAWLWHDHPDDIRNFYTKIGLEHREFQKPNNPEQIKKEENNRQPENTSASASAYQSIQRKLTIPKADNNKNYYASIAIKKVIGRKKQKKSLKAFLKCKKNVAWFQLAGEAGQGKSRLAFDLMRKALGLGWCAGFVEKDCIEFFKNHGKDWQPDKPHLFIFDYVIGREEEIKHIFDVLLSKSPDQRKYQHDIRILLLERQRWDQGIKIRDKDQKDNIELKISAHIADKAKWFLNLCEEDDFEAKSLRSCQFKDGVEELKELGTNDLVTIVKQLFAGKELTISDKALEKTLERIDNSGRPLYAYLLAEQLSDNQKNHQNWTRIDLLNYQLMRDKEHRWKKAFEGKVPVWGEDHPAMKLAVLATIVREFRFQDKKVKQYFGSIDTPLRKEAVAITSGYLTNDNKLPHKIYALEPDLLGTWFVLYCFREGLEFEELLDLAWRYWPKETAVFLLRITQDFIDLPKEYEIWEVSEKLLSHKPPDKNHYQALANVAAVIAYKLYQRDLTIPQNIIAALDYAVNLSDPVVMTYLGTLYHLGIGIAKNPKEAVKLFQKAAKKGNTSAMYNLAMYYVRGDVVGQNLGKAIRLFKQAADKGDSTAMFSLGQHYKSGMGVKQDLNKAFDLFRQALKAGEKNAIYPIQDILLKKFLGKGNYKPQKIYNWPNTKLPHLTTVPVFDSPIMTGNWKQLTTKEITVCFDKIIASFEILELVEELNGYTVQYVRRLSLSFYKDCSLVDIQLYNPSSKNTLVFSVVFNTKKAILLNGKSNIIYDLNTHLLVFDDQKSTLDYLQFFNSYIQGNNRPFQIIFNLNEIPFEKEANQQIPDRIKENFFSPRYIEGDFEKEGWQQFEAYILYRNALYITVLKVFRDGMTEKGNFDLVLDKLPILQRQYNGVFRIPLRSLND